MKVKMRNIVLGLVAGVLSFPAHADITGKWISDKNDEGKQISVEIYNCEDKVCGKIIDVHNSDNTSIIGMQIIENMQKKNELRYSGGRIFAPDTEKWYKSKIKVNPNNTLKVSGCVAGGLICRGQIWTQTN